MWNVFTSNCAKRSSIKWNVFTPYSRVSAQNDHESCGMCLLKRGEKTCVYTSEMETTLTDELPDVASETVVSDAFDRVPSSVEHAYQYREALYIE